MFKTIIQLGKRLTPLVPTLADIVLLLAFILVIFSGQLRASQCSVEKIMTDEQFSVVHRSYEIGEPHNLGYSLAAIVWQESSAGEYLVNSDERSYGPYQINLKTAMNRLDEQENFTKQQKNRLASNLMRLEYSSLFAIKELQYWLSIHGNDWSKVWASYNGGWSYDHAKPKLYSLEIASKIRKLKNCFGDNNENNRTETKNGSRIGRSGSNTGPVWNFR